MRVSYYLLARNEYLCMSFMNIITSMNIKKLIAFVTISMSCSQYLSAQITNEADREEDYDVDMTEQHTQSQQLTYSIETGGVLKSGDHVSQLLVYNNHGIIAPFNNAAYLREKMLYSLNSLNGFFLNAGSDIVEYSSSSNSYYSNNIHVQQLFLDAGFKKLICSIGTKEEEPMLVNYELSSGNMVWSENSRPIPRIKLGTTDYVAIPGTNKWLNFYFDISYGRQMDGTYNKDNYSKNCNYRYNPLIENAYFHRKNLFIKTKANALVSATLGLEHIAQFGGKVNSEENDVSFSDISNVLFAKKASNDDITYCYIGAIDGRIDVHASKWTLSAYSQFYVDAIHSKPNGSKFIQRNGNDGLYGLEWKNKSHDAAIAEVVLEYLETTNQGGVVSIDMTSYDGTLYNNTSCSYYNDDYYGAWANYGLTNGNTLFKSPIYNDDHYLGYESTLVKAVNFGVIGNITPKLSYKLRLNTTESWGEPFAYFSKKQRDFSMLLGMNYKYKDWSFSPCVAFGNGQLYGNNTSASIRISKLGTIFRK